MVTIDQSAQYRSLLIIQSYGEICGPVPLHLREQDDVLPLAKHFIGYYNNKFGHVVSGISPEVQEKLIRYNWPGNIDELRLIVQRAILLTRKGEITLAELPDDLKDRDNDKPEVESFGNCS